MIGVHHRCGRDRFACRIVEKPAHVIMQCALVAFQGKDIVATLINITC